MQECTLSTHRKKSWVECSPGIFKFYTCRITPLHVCYLLMYNKYQVSVFAQKWKLLLPLLIGYRWLEQSE